jgi:hypothetical protein
MSDRLAEWRHAWQSDAEPGPVAQQVILDNDDVRIWEIVLDPGEEIAVHNHLIDYVTVTIEASRMEAREHTGQLREIDAKPGDVGWTSVADGQMHALRTVGTTRFRNPLIENKRPGGRVG